MATTEAQQPSGALATRDNAPPSISVFTGGITQFESAQRMAAALCSSTMVPDAYQGQNNLGNCLVALDLANRLGVSPLAIMQNVDTIHGRPAFRSSFLIAMVNSCGRFTTLEFHFDDEANPTSCYAAANSITSGVRLAGQKVTVEMAKAEGWWERKGSKWPTMTGQMLTYRAAGFWQRIHAPDLTLGFRTADEVIDVESVVVSEVEPAPKPDKPTRARRGLNPPAPAAEKAEPSAATVIEAEVLESPPFDPEAETDLMDQAAEPATEEKDPRRSLGNLPTQPPAAASAAQAPAPEPEPEPADSEVFTQGLAMVTAQVTISQLDGLRAQADAFLAQGEIRHPERERLENAINTRAGYLSKPIAKFQASAANLKLKGDPTLADQFRNAFGVPADQLELVATERQHLEAIKFFQSATAT